MKKILLCFLAIGTIVISCKTNTPAPANNTPPPAPKVCFTASKTLIDSGETVSFTNCTTLASSYLWSFGDGSSSLSTDVSPTHIYSGSVRPATGYKVTLTAYNSANKTSDSATIIYVGHRMIDSVRIDSIPTGTIFTPGTDMFIQCGPSQNTSEYSATHRVVNSFPATFALESLNILIPETDAQGGLNNGAWKGHLFKFPSTSICTFGGNPPLIFLSRGLNVNPIHVSNNGVVLDFYYHLVK